MFCVASSSCATRLTNIAITARCAIIAFTGVVIDYAVEVEFFNFVLGMNEIFAQAASRLYGGRDANLLEVAYEGLGDASVIRQSNMAFVTCTPAAAAAGVASGSGLILTWIPCWGGRWQP